MKTHLVVRLYGWLTAWQLEDYYDIQAHASANGSSCSGGHGLQFGSDSPQLHSLELKQIL